LILLYNLKRLYENADFSLSGLGFYLSVFEQIVPPEEVKKYKDIISGDTGSLKEYLKESLIKLNETRSTNDLVYDNERALTIANRLIAYSFENCDYEAILLAMILKADYSLIYQGKSAESFIEFKLPELDTSKLYPVYSDRIKFLEHLPNNESDILIWIVITEKELFYLSLKDSTFNYSQSTDWSFSHYMKLVEDEFFLTLKFDDTAKDKSGVYTITYEEHKQEGLSIAHTLSFLKLDVSCKLRPIFIVKDMELSKFPHNLFLSMDGDFLYLHNPIANILSTEWYLNRNTILSLPKNYSKSIWIPTEAGDWTINQLYNSIEKILIDYSISTCTKLEIEEALSSDINIVSSHGAKDISKNQVIFPSDSPIFNLHKVCGSGKVLLFLVCYSGTMSKDFIRNNVSSLVKEFIYNGYEAVIAPAWALHINIPPIWLPVFFESFNSGDSIVVSTHKANLAVYEKYPTPSAWACLHLFGNPNIKVSKD
jgi:hypothetical protein